MQLKVINMWMFSDNRMHCNEKGWTRGHSTSYFSCARIFLRGAVSRLDSERLGRELLNPKASHFEWSRQGPSSGLLKCHKTIRWKETVQILKSPMKNGYGPGVQSVSLRVLLLGSGIQGPLAYHSPLAPDWKLELQVVKLSCPKQLKPSFIITAGSCFSSSVQSQLTMPSCGSSMASLVTFSCASTTLMLWPSTGYLWSTCSLTCPLFCPFFGSWTTGESGMLSLSGQPSTASVPG